MKTKWKETQEWKVGAGARRGGTPAGRGGQRCCSLIPNVAAPCRPETLPLQRPETHPLPPLLPRTAPQVQNDNKPLWVRSPKEVGKDEYDAFFKATFRWVSIIGTH